MKYNNSIPKCVWKKRIFGKIPDTGIFLLLIVISSCRDNAVLPETIQEPVISRIDGKPVVTISAADYYNANSRYIDDVVERLSQNGRVVVEAINQQIIKRDNKLQEVVTDAVIVGLSELRSASAYKSNTSGSSLIDDISSHIRVVDESGAVEEFELILQPHGMGESVAPATTVNFDAATTWLALNPDHFYVEEDSDGNEIWPVTFPAVSLDEPDHEIEVTLDRDGTLTWPSDVQGKSSTLSSVNQLVYMDNMAILDSCIDCGGGDTGGSNPPGRFITSEIKTAPFLALKTIRLDGTGDGDGASELQMHVEPYTSYNYKFKRNWNYVFDHKRGMTNRPLWFDDFSLLGIIESGYKLYTDLTGQLESSAESIFSGRNTRTFGGDSRIYQTPDVNYKNRDYYFTNMRSWSYLDIPNFSSEYSEGSRLDYFPIVPLGNYSWRVLLMENDSRYPYANMRQRNTLGHDVWTFNMGNGQYENIYTSVDGKRTESGKSDDLMWHSGISNISDATVTQMLGSKLEITAVSPGGFKYVLTKINRTAEFRPID